MFFRKEKDPEKICLFCTYATVSDDGEKVLCKHKGDVKSDYTCRRFKYDYLKRDPGKAAKIAEFEYVDIND